MKYTEDPGKPSLTLKPGSQPHIPLAPTRVAPERSNPKYDLAVAYRIYPRVSKPAQRLPFGDDKLKQAEICLQSFRNALGSLRTKIWAILDGCPAEYRQMFLRHFSTEDLVFVEVDSIGNQATYAKQMEILIAQRDAELVYFAEDDYIYLPDAFPPMLEFMSGDRGVDFVTPYDHPDCYGLELHHEPKWVTFRDGHHWRTAGSTCLTFLTKKSTLARYERHLGTYSYGNDDCSMWLALTKSRVFNAGAALRLLASGEYHWKLLAKAWLYGWRQIIFGRAAKLWAPMPGLATHLRAGLFSPGTNWLALMQRAPGTERSREPVSGDKLGPVTRAVPSTVAPIRGTARRVAVLVLNWNNWKDTNECLASLQDLDYDDYHVIVIDNGSTDDSVRHVRDRFPEVEILELGQNVGFAGGNNAGIRRALGRGAEYVWLLNNDATCDRAALRSMVGRADADSHIGAVGSAIYHLADPGRLQAWGGGYVNFLLGHSRHFPTPVPDGRIQFLTGASLLLRRAVLESVGFLDDKYFLYWEDADYCFRMRRAGWSLGVAGDSKVWHNGQSTTGKRSVRLDFNFNRSAKRFFEQYSPWPGISIWTGIGLRILKRVLVGDWRKARAVWESVKPADPQQVTGAARHL